MAGWPFKAELAGVDGKIISTGVSNDSAECNSNSWHELMNISKSWWHESRILHHHKVPASVKIVVEFYGIEYLITLQWIYYWRIFINMVRRFDLDFLATVMAMPALESTFVSFIFESPLFFTIVQWSGNIFFIYKISKSDTNIHFTL